MRTCCQSSVSWQTNFLYVVSAVSQVLEGLNRFVDEGSQTEDYKALLKILSQSNFDRLGFEKQAGESDEDEMVRQLIVSKYLRLTMKRLKLKLARFLTAIVIIWKTPAAIRRRYWSTKSSIMKARS